MEEAQTVLPSLVASGEQLLILGGGSNLLLTADYNGTVVHSRILGVQSSDDGADHVLLRSGSGVVWDELVEQCVA